jgi:hypothetical protein
LSSNDCTDATDLQPLPECLNATSENVRHAMQNVSERAVAAGVGRAREMLGVPLGEDIPFVGLRLMGIHTGPRFEFFPPLPRVDSHGVAREHPEIPHAVVSGIQITVTPARTA